MIESGIEGPTFCWIGFGDLYLIEDFAPGGVGLVFDFLVVPVGNLGVEVATGFFDAGEGCSDFDLNQVSGAEIEADVCTGGSGFVCLLGAARMSGSAAPGATDFEGAAEANDEIAVEACEFSTACVQAPDGVNSCDFTVGGIDCDGAVARVAVIVLDQNPGRSPLVELKLHDAGPCGSGELGCDVVVGKRDGVAVGQGLFVGAGEGRRSFDRPQFEIAGLGHDGDRAVILGAGAAHEMTAAEALDACVGEVVWCDALLFT